MQRGIVPIYLRMTPADIAFVKFLFESYEGVGIVRTVDRRAAIIVILVVPDFVAVARGILASLRGTISYTEIDPPAGDVDDWLMRELNADE